jgi:hypothetical protein
VDLKHLEEEKAEIKAQIVKTQVACMRKIYFKKLPCIHPKMCFYYKVVRKEIFTVWYGTELTPVSFFYLP